MTPSERASDERVLAEFDQLFVSKPDALTALYTVVQATKTDLPLPPVVAEWLNQRIAEYLTGRAKTLDAALGLASVRGRHSAVRRFYESIRRLRWRDPIYALHELASLGAAIDDAALVVATKCGVGASTLARK